MIQISVKTDNKTQLMDITQDIQAAVTKSKTRNGLCLVYVPHTTAGITINESADPAVASDMLAVLNQIIPWEANYRHLEGNSAAHIKTTLVGTSQMVAIENHRLVLGTWQGIFFCEFDGPRRRNVHIHIIEGQS